MRICDLSSGAGRLVRATKKLRQQWAETKTHWNDANSSQFEQTCLRPLEHQVQETLSAIQRMATVLQQVEQACQDDQRPDSGF